MPSREIFFPAVDRGVAPPIFCKAKLGTCLNSLSALFLTCNICGAMKNSRRAAGDATEMAKIKPQLALSWPFNNH